MDPACIFMPLIFSTMKKLFFLSFLFPLFSFAQPDAGYYINTITYDTTNHTCCVEFVDSSSSNVSIGSWYYYFGDGTAPVTVPNYTHCFTDTGVYEVCLVVQDSNGDSDSSCCLLHFQDLDSAFLVCDSLTGIFETATSRFQLFPNPSAGSFTIKGIYATSYELSIISAQGDIIYINAYDGSSAAHTIENLSPGIYLVVIRTEDSILVNKKIIVL